jgi:trehalose 2-sulfotransferase
VEEKIEQLNKKRSFQTQKSFDPNLDLPRTLVFRRYLILSSPRSGSTMISSALKSTSMAGVPQEYFNPNALSAVGAERSTEKAMAFLADVEKRRTSSNGYFGMKMHYNQFVSVFINNGIIHPLVNQFLSSFDYFILTYRRDKVLQAISYLQAHRSGLWNTTNPELEGKVTVELADDDISEVTFRMKNLIDEEMGWRHILNGAKPKFYEIAYEDLVADEALHMQRIADFLDLPLNGIVPKAEIKKISNESSLVAKQKYLKAIGVIS